ncbi:MAG: M48 family metallopeptidase [Phaeodactylibacter sp.]|nr:M48 family metallopeptidase [Phaeodactylibacter sp.]
MPKFTYRGHTYDYTIRRSARKTLGIYVHPDLRIEVRAPHNATLEDIEERVRKRRSWIVRQWREFTLYHPLRQPPVYQNGATHLYLGRQYRLRILEGPRNGVKLKGGYLEVTHHPASTAERALTAWYRERADEWFPRLLEEVYPRFRSFSIPKPKVIHKRMEKRWGSCKVSEQRILLNTELIQGPKVGIEYVIAHELAHLIHPHHTPAFYAVLDRVMPEWREWKGRLEGVMA